MSPQAAINDKLISGDGTHEVWSLIVVSVLLLLVLLTQLSFEMWSVCQYRPDPIVSLSLSHIHSLFPFLFFNI